MRTRLLLAVFAALLNLVAEAQVLDPVSWTFETVQGEDGDALVFRATIEEGWNVYSQYLESEDGPVATSVTYENPAQVELLGKATETGDRHEGFDELFDMRVVKFEHEFEIRQPVKFAGEAPVTGYLTFMTCDDEQCLPPTDVDFRFGPVAAETSPAPGQSELAVTDQSSQILEPVTWSFRSKPLTDSTYALEAVADIEDGWMLYAQDVGEDGPVPTTFFFTETAGFELLDGVTEAGKRKSGFDPVFGVDVTKYLAPQAVFTQDVLVRDAGADIVGYLEFMTCDDTQCLPPSEVAFRFRPAEGLAGSIDFDTYERLAAGESGEDAPAPIVTGGDALSQFSIDQSGSATTCGIEAAANDVSDRDSLGLIFLLGFGGGLLALLTPCVFPMVPLTVSFFTSPSSTRGRGLRRAGLYGLSIIVIYVTLGLAITAAFGADALNLLSTNAWFNIGFGVLFVVFALSFFGFFEIQLPSSWANRTDRAADQGGLLGIFFMAFTLSLVSFSCTGPIIGTLLVQTATGGGATLFGRIPVAPLLGMLGFATALALPFTLFAAFPTWLKALPKSGGWMNVVKVTLGFVELALALKFFSIADLTMGWKFLPYEVFVGAWVLCALGLAAYYFGYLRTPHERHTTAHEVGKVSLGLGVVACALAVYLGAGFRYSERSETFVTPNLLSGVAPPAGHSYIYPKDCPQNIDCFKDLGAGLAYAKTVGKPVLIDFTGYGCVNCRRMEDNVWGQPGVYEKLRDDYVLVSLYVDDREELAEPFVSDYSGRKLRTVGNKWADFQARTFDRNSQPYYVLVSPGGEVLNQPVPYTPDVAEYEAFLKCGLERFEAVSRTEDDARLGRL